MALGILESLSYNFFEPLVLAAPPLNTALAISMQKKACQDQCHLQDHHLEAMAKKLSGNLKHFPLAFTAFRIFFVPFLLSSKRYW